MKTKHLSLLVILMVLFSLLTAMNIPKSPNKFDRNGKKTGKWTVLCDSSWNYVDNIQLAHFYRIIHYKDGKPMGKVKDCYLSGKIHNIGYLISDNPDVFNGKYQAFYEDGKKETEGDYQNGKQIGTWTEWNEDGTYGKGSFLNGKPDGLWSFWYQNGKKLKLGEYKDGKEEGEWTFWYPNGYKKEQGEYKNGLKNGFWREWNIDYSWAEGSYINGVKAKDWKANAPD